MVYRYKRREKIDSRILIIALVLIGGLVALNSLSFEQPVGTFNIMEIPDLSTVGYVQVEPEAAVVENRGVVSLTGGCYRIIATTEVTQAQSIAAGIEGTVSFRPNTHDLMKDAFESLGIEIVMVKIIGIEQNTYIGRLILKQGNTILSLDSRPSDGTALAVRTDSPIYIEQSLLEENGDYIC